MLVLSRKIGEKIMIGDGIVLTVLDMRGRQVRLGIEAPSEVPILRGELSFFQEAEAPVSGPHLVAERSGRH